MKSIKEPLVMVKPSTVHGVGLFTVFDIKKGQKLNIFHNDEECVFQSFKVLANKSKTKDQKRLIDFLQNYFFISEDGKGLLVPKDFHKLSIGYYINCSQDNPNIELTIKNNKMITKAIKNIKAGSELFMNYELDDTSWDKN